MKRTLIGGAVLSASLLLGVSPALACGNSHHHGQNGHHGHHSRTHVPARHKPGHHHKGKPCQCRKPKPAPRPPICKPHPAKHHHHKPHAPKPPVVHPRPPVVTPPPVAPHHATTPRVVSHPHVTTVTYATPARLPRTGGTPWVLIYAGGALLATGTALALVGQPRKQAKAWRKP